MSDSTKIDLSCYEDIIGLSRTACNCVQYADNPGVNSLSDLYLDETEGIELKKLHSLENCEKGGLWEIMYNARENAIKTVIYDTNAKLLTLNKLKRQPFKGVIGRAGWKKDVILNKTYAGNRYFMADIVGGYWRITQINTVFSNTGTIHLDIYNNLNEVCGSFDLLTQANALKVNSIPTLDLPMHSPYVDNLIYYFVYTSDANNLPKQLDFSCGCDSSTKWVYDCTNPQFISQTTKAGGWLQFTMAANWQGDILEFSDVDCVGVCNCNNGLLINCEFGCKVNEVVCQDTLDFENNPLAGAIALAVQFKAAEYLSKQLLSSTNINRYTMLDGEMLASFINNYIKKYNSYIDYIIANVNIRMTDCLECKDIIQMTKQGIFA